MQKSSIFRHVLKTLKMEKIRFFRRWFGPFLGLFYFFSPWKITDFSAQKFPIFPIGNFWPGNSTKSSLRLRLSSPTSSAAIWSIFPLRASRAFDLKRAEMPGMRRLNQLESTKSTEIEPPTVRSLRRRLRRSNDLGSQFPSDLRSDFRI